MNSGIRTCLIFAAVLGAVECAGASAPERSGSERTPDAGLAVVPAAGGDDVLVLTHPRITLARGYSMDIADNGDIYVAVEVDESEGAVDAEIRILRSQDGGTTWTSWGELASDLPNVNYFTPCLHIAEGDQDRVYVAYGYNAPGNGSTIDVAYAPLALSQAQWTTRTVLAQAGVVFRRPDLVSDAVNAPSYKLLLTAEGEDGNGADIWFSRSADFGGTWSAEYRFATALTGVTTFASPVIACGFGGVVHVAYEVWPVAAGDRGIGYRRALNTAANGLADWQPGLTLASRSDGWFDTFATVAASPGTANAIVAWESFNPNPAQINSVARLSGDGGATWGAATPNAIPFVGHGELLALPDGLGFGAGIIPFGGFGIARAAEAAPLQWTAAQIMSDHWAGTAGDAPVPAGDPTRQHRLGLVWAVRGDDGPDSLFFDAEWRRDPGWPNLVSGFPVALPDRPHSSPLLANLDDDAQLEIALTDAAGRVRVHEANGALKAGWPLDLGDLPYAHGVAVGDLDGDGRYEIVAGTSNGLIYRIAGDGTTFPGWPVNLGANAPASVSIGAIAAGSFRQIVACSGREVNVLLPDGTNAPGFPRDVDETISAAAAIGDVDADGGPDLVVVGGHTVTVLRGSGTLLSELFTPASTYFYQASLADIDLDGDLEIALPTIEGQLLLVHHEGDSFGPGWPFVDGTGSPITTVAIADVDGDDRPELAFAAHAGTAHLVADDASELPGWPHTTVPGWFLPGGPIADDLDGGGADVAFAALDQNAYGWRALTDPLPGWPRALGAPCEWSPATGDLDHDGIVDIVFATENALIAYRTGSPVDRTHPFRIWPMEGANPERQACLGCGPDAVTGAGARTPSEVRFAAPRPNPTRGAVAFEVELPQPALVRLTVHDLAGREIRSVARTEAGAGTHRFAWDGCDATGAPTAPGLYFARLEVEGPGVRAAHTRAIARLR